MLTSNFVHTHIGFLDGNPLLYAWASLKLTNHCLVSTEEKFCRWSFKCDDGNVFLAIKQKKFVVRKKLCSPLITKLLWMKLFTSKKFS